MSFVILRHAKIKNASKHAAIGHNHRLGDESQKVNIDVSLGGLNRSLMGAGALKRLNDLLPEKMRKDAVVAIETVVSASPEFFDSIEKDRTKLAQNPKFKKWVLDTQVWMKKEWGDNVVDAVLHMDESTPHIHFLTVPLVNQRLCAKEFLAIGVMQRHQSQYAAAMAPHGLQRGIPVVETKRKHIGLKESSGSGGQGAKLAEELATAKTELARVTGYFENLKRISKNDVNAISTLKKQVKELEKELAEAKEAKFKDARVEKPELQAPKEVLAAVDLVLIDEARQRLEAEKTAKDAFLEQYKGLALATKLDVDVGVPVASCGRLVVLHVGRGKHVLHDFPVGQVMPGLKTQQAKSGIAR